MTSNEKVSQPSGGGVRVNREELLESVVVALFALILFGVTFTFEEVPEILAQGIGPAIFPRAVLIFMFLMAVIQGIKAIRLSSDAAASYKPRKPIPAIVYITAGTILLFVVGLYTIGALPSVLVFCFLLSLIWGERRYIAMIITFLAFTASVYLLFVILLGSNLP